MYTKHPTLIARPLHSNMGLGGALDIVKAIGGAGFNVFAQAEQAKGAQNALNAQAAINANQGGIQPMTIMLLGGAGLVMYLLLRKKKPA